MGPDAEKTLVAGAVRTDLILSAEIMVIALNEVAHEPFFSRLVILLVVALAITVVVYGVVGLIVRMDDMGLALAGRDSRGGSQRVGRALVTGMPKVLAVISVVGTVAMLWVGGHILLTGTDELGWHAPRTSSCTTSRRPSRTPCPASEDSSAGWSTRSSPPSSASSWAPWSSR